MLDLELQGLRLQQSGSVAHDVDGSSEDTKLTPHCFTHLRLTLAAFIVNDKSTFRASRSYAVASYGVAVPSFWAGRVLRHGGAERDDPATHHN
jgi:hypothetical protein